MAAARSDPDGARRCRAAGRAGEIRSSDRAGRADSSGRSPRHRQGSAAVNSPRIWYRPGGELQESPTFRSFRPLRKYRSLRRRPLRRSAAVDSPGSTPDIMGVPNPTRHEAAAAPDGPDRVTATTTTGGASPRRSPVEDQSYWSTTRRPLPCLVVHPADPGRLRGRGDLAGRPVGRRPPGRGRRLGPPGAGRARADRPLALADRPDLGPARLAGARPPRLAVPPGRPLGDGDREPDPGRGAWSA